jgi:hypothetical protein
VPNIPISQVVQVNPAVIGAGGGQSSLDGLLLTQNAGVAPGQPIIFYTATDVANFFGPGTDEAVAASTYFAGILNGGQQPYSLTFARYAQAAVGAGVYGAPLSLTLAQLQALSGTLTVTTAGGTKTSSTINLATATSFANAATLMTSAFTSPDFAITYDAQRRRFVLTTTATGAAVTSSVITGTLAAPVGLAASSGAYQQAAGVAADTASTAMTRTVAQYSNWGVFSTVWAATIADRTALAAWTSSDGNFQFAYVAWDLEAASTVANNAASFGAIVNSTPYQGVIPVYGGLQIAAGVLAWAASTSYEVEDGRTTLAFRQVTAGPAPSVTDLATANALLSNGYTYLGAYANSVNNYSVFYNGSLSGQFEWADTYLGQIWLRRTLQQALFETLLAYNSLPYNADGYNAVYQGAMDTVAQAVTAGVVRQGVTLSASQKAQINSQAGTNIDQEVSAVGWYLQVRDPISTSVRTDRGSPSIKFWYCDGGSIQQIVVTSTTVL